MVMFIQIVFQSPIRVSSKESEEEENRGRKRLSFSGDKGLGRQRREERVYGLVLRVEFEEFFRLWRDFK